MSVRGLPGRLWQVFSAWWSDCVKRHLALVRVSELKSHADGELGRIASQLGISVFEARRLAGRGPEAARLLSCWMAVFDIDPLKVSRIEPQVSEDLKANCVRCHSRRRCLADLVRDGGDAEWQHYCPDAATLLALSALPWMTWRVGLRANAF
ncbi:MAG TPA: hypothetical protein VNK48_07815 [Xanthobacteraceae bacterium]|nr:hypothetical protein [Xanthobacteraceae bacterium]